MKIIRILKKDSSNAVIFLDNNDKLFLSYETIIKHGLRKDDEISEALAEELINENRKFFIKQAAFRLIARRLHSEKELRLKLFQKKYDKNLTDEVINHLKENNYLDDYKFALEFIAEKKNKKTGKNRIISQLINKGISREIISQTIEEKFSGEEDLQNALRLGEIKFNQLVKRKVPAEKIKQKVYNFLISRGFNYEISREALEKIEKKSADFF